MDFNKEEIIKNKLLLDKDFNCIYFLIKNNEIVYVGQSTRGIRRIYEHTDKEFDYYNIIKVDKEELDLKETEAIIKFNPKYNKSIPIKNNLYILKSKINKEYNISPNGFRAIELKYGIKPKYKKNYKRETIEFCIERGLKEKILVQNDLHYSCGYKIKKYPNSNKIKEVLLWANYF